MKIIHDIRIFCRSIVLLEEFNCLHVESSYKNKSQKNERGKPNRGCHKPALKCFYSFYFSVKNGRWDTITQKCIYAYNLQNIMYLLAISKKLLQTVHSLILQSIKLNIHHNANLLFRYATKTIFRMLNNTEWTLNE